MTCKQSWLARKTHDQWLYLRTLAARLVEESEIICLSIVLATEEDHREWSKRLACYF